MLRSLVECVPNISEGRNPSIVDRVQSAITSVPGVRLLHRTSDWDHNRSVLTFAAQPGQVEEAAFRAVTEAALLIDLTTHSGVHPRVGALDVLPFVPLGAMPLSECVSIAHSVGKRIASELGIPVYFYGAAALKPDRFRLEDVRRGQFEGLSISAPIDPAKAPDVGGQRLHPRAGAVIVGARKVLIAFNVNLQTTDLTVAQRIAKRIRERDGGFPGVKALGLPLQSRNVVQVSLNITDFELAPVHVIYTEIVKLASEAGVEVLESELIGLLPRQAMEMAAAALLKLREFRSDSIIENKLEAEERD